MPADQTPARCSRGNDEAKKDHDHGAVPDCVVRDEASSRRRLTRVHTIYLEAVGARARAERVEAFLRRAYEVERARHDREWGEPHAC